jgi:hypothetical protein
MSLNDAIRLKPSVEQSARGEEMVDISGTGAITKSRLVLDKT